MRYLELNYREKTYTSNNEIHDILLKEEFYWLIDSEIENAKLEIKNNTLISVCNPILLYRRLVPMLFPTSSNIEFKLLIFDPILLFEASITFPLSSIGLHLIYILSCDPSNDFINAFVSL